MKLPVVEGGVTMLAVTVPAASSAPPVAFTVTVREAHGDDDR